MNPFSQNPTHKNTIMTTWRKNVFEIFFMLLFFSHLLKIEHLIKTVSVITLLLSDGVSRSTPAWILAPADPPKSRSKAVNVEKAPPPDLQHSNNVLQLRLKPSVLTPIDRLSHRYDVLVLEISMGSFFFFLQVSTQVSERFFWGVGYKHSKNLYFLIPLRPPECMASAGTCSTGRRLHRKTGPLVWREFRFLQEKCQRGGFLRNASQIPNCKLQDSFYNWMMWYFNYLIALPSALTE